ncbi:MAG: polyprenyl diphosphate synthase, partial [Gallionella sp.]
MTNLSSSTRTIPEIAHIPRHIAIIMDGNGRWAKQRFMPRVVGHQRGVESLRTTVRACRDMGVEYLTVFAFSSENWRRPVDEVSFLMSLFLKMLEREIASLHKNNIRLKIIGDRDRFDDKLKRSMQDAEQLTSNNTGLTFTIAANYGGRWDVMHAVHALLTDRPELATSFTEEDLQP